MSGKEDLDRVRSARDRLQVELADVVTASVAAHASKEQLQSQVSSLTLQVQDTTSPIGLWVYADQTNLATRFAAVVVDAYDLAVFRAAAIDCNFLTPLCTLSLVSPAGTTRSCQEQCQ